MFRRHPALFQVVAACDLMKERRDIVARDYPDCRMFRQFSDMLDEQGIDLKEGIYLMYSGPNYETPAEIRAFRNMGADVVGMSCIPEAIVARHCGMRVAAISCVTSMAAGVLDSEKSHETVLATASQNRNEFARLLNTIISIIQPIVVE